MKSRPESRLSNRLTQGRADQPRRTQNSRRLYCLWLRASSTRRGACRTGGLTVRQSECPPAQVEPIHNRQARRNMQKSKVSIPTLCHATCTCTHAGCSHQVVLPVLWKWKLYFWKPPRGWLRSKNPCLTVVYLNPSTPLHIF